MISEMDCRDTLLFSLRRSFHYSAFFAESRLAHKGVEKSGFFAKPVRPLTQLERSSSCNSPSLSTLRALSIFEVAIPATHPRMTTGRTSGRDVGWRIQEFFCSLMSP